MLLKRDCQVTTAGDVDSALRAIDTEAPDLVLLDLLMPGRNGMELLPELVALYPKIDLEEVVSIRFIPPTYHLRYRDDGKLGAIANLDLVHEHTQLVINDPERAVIELGLGNTESCPEPGQETTTTVDQ